HGHFSASAFSEPASAPRVGVRHFGPLPPLELALDWNHIGGKRWVSKHPQFAANGASMRIAGNTEASPGWDGDLRVFDGEATADFEDFVRAAISARAKIAQNKEPARFFDLSLRYLLKGWEADGREKLLW